MTEEELIKHYVMMERVQKAGGLRKELTPEICVIMHLEYHTNMNILQCCILANNIKNKIKQEKKNNDRRREDRNFITDSV